MWDAKLRLLDAVLAAIALTVGFIAPWPEVLAGLCFSLAGGFVGMVVAPPIERLGFFNTMSLALVIGLLAGLWHPHAAFGIDEWPLQLVMGLAGLLSRPVAKKAATGDWALPFGKSGGGGA
ncbi:MAG: hypothetical protein B7Y88_14245 [Sphingomonadales bacterium 32-64-17]|nr:MAG: hypothetical protein B7Y88_14245 [Sphingomonadales bacterium 32-64-17]